MSVCATCTTGGIRNMREHVCPGPRSTDPYYQPPPPGDTRKQLPPHVLAASGFLPYMSTACQRAMAIEQAIPSHTDMKDLPMWRDRMHAECRYNNKFDGELCFCRCHQREAA